MSETARTHRLGLYLKSRDRQLSRNIAKKSVITNSKQLTRTIMATEELQNEVNCMNDSKDFQDAESVRSGNSHVTSRPESFHLIRYLKGC